MTEILLYPGRKKADTFVIPKGIINIHRGAFYPCAFKSITIPEGVVSIGTGAFQGCADLASVILPESLVGIGVFAFNGCAALSDIIIPEGVGSVGSCAFMNSRVNITVAGKSERPKGWAKFENTGKVIWDKSAKIKEDKNIVSQGNANSIAEHKE